MKTLPLPPASVTLKHASDSPRLAGRYLLGAVLILLTCLALVVAARWGWFETRVGYYTRILQSHPAAGQRGAAAHQLGQMGPKARAAAPALAAALHDQGAYLTGPTLFPAERRVATDAAGALQQIGGLETAEALVNALAKVRQQDQVQGVGEPWRIAQPAGEILQAIGPEARPVAIRLLDILDGWQQGSPAEYAVPALEAMQLQPGSPEARRAVEVLPQFLNWGQSEIQGTTFRLLLALAPGDEAVLRQVVAALPGARGISQRAVVAAVAGEGERAVPLLVAQLADRNHENAIAALSQMDPALVLPALREKLEDADPQTRAGAEQVLARLQPSDSESRTP